MERIFLRIVRLAIGLLIVLALTNGWLGHSRAQLSANSPLRVLAAQPAGSTAPFVPGVVLVRLTESAARTAEAAQRLGAEAGTLSPLAISGQPGLYRLIVPAGDEQANAARLAARPDVLYAEPDFLFFAAETTPNDSLYGRYQWNLRHIRANTGWDRTTGSSSVVIAIADTGVDLGHPDLAAKIVPGIDEVNNDSNAQDDNGHGTHVASIAAALSNNGAGIAGVDWDARIMPVKVLNANGSGSSENVARGIVWAADNGADVVNLSLSGTNPSAIIQNAVQYAYIKGVLIIAAAGNAYENGNPTSYPAAYPNVLGVAAVNDSDGHASYSNSGDYVDVAAPGGDPSSSTDGDSRHWIPGAYWSANTGSTYAQASGTSQAAPHVAGLAGLLLSLNGSLTPDQLLQIITSSAVDVQTPGWDSFSGYGRIDVAAALAAVAPPSTPTPTSTPTTSPTPTITPTATPTFTPSATPTPTPPDRSREDVRINSTSANAQSNPALSIDSANNLTALWRDRRSGVDSLYSASLAADEVNWGVNLRLAGTEQISDFDQIGVPRLVAGGAGRFVAVWHDDQDGDSESDIFVSQLDSGKTVWDRPAQINGDSTPPALQVNPAIALTENGVLLAVWEVDRSAIEANTPAQLYWSQSNGTDSPWGVEQPVSPSPNSQRVPRLANSEGTVYAVWVEVTRGQSHIVTSEFVMGSTNWTTPTVLASSIDDELIFAPDIAVDGKGHRLIVWQGIDHTGSHLYATRWLADSGWSNRFPAGNETAIDIEEHLPRLTSNKQEMALVWTDTRAGAGDVYVRWAAWPGGEWSPPVRVNQDDSGTEQSNPDVAIDQWGNTTVVWSDSRGGTSAPDIYARFIPAGERYRTFLALIER